MDASCLRRGVLVLGMAFILAPATGAQGPVSLIAFQSNRDGNEEIYVMNPDGTDQRRLTNHPASDIQPAWSPDGARIAFASRRHGRWYTSIYVMNADGSNPVQLTDFQDAAPSWSPDGTRIVFTSGRDDVKGESKGEIYVMNADGSGQTRLTHNPAVDKDPDWSPDGTRIAFHSDRDGNVEIYVMNADGSNPVNLTGHRANDYAPDWSPDGLRIAFWSYRDNNQEVYAMNADGSSPTRLTAHPAVVDYGPSWSPDGSKVAFYSDRDGNEEIYVMNADGTGTIRLTGSPEIDRSPSWSPVLSLEVSCDVKPGSDPNEINLKNQGVIPVAILTTPQFDARAVDPLSVTCGPGQAREAHGLGHIEDVDNDGDLDMVLHFRTQESGIQPGDTRVTLSGRTVQGKAFRGSDGIVTR